MLKNNLIVIYFFVSTVTACASAPKPPECKGEFKPVNIMEQKNKKSSKQENKVVTCIKGSVHG